MSIQIFTRSFNVSKQAEMYFAFSHRNRAAKEVSIVGKMTFFWKTRVAIMPKELNRGNAEDAVMNLRF